MIKLKENKSHIIRILIFLILIMVADQITGRILKQLYFSQKTGQGKHMSYILSDCNADVLIFGNSRAQHHYDPKIIADSLNMTCYNAGIDGGHSILMPYYQLKIILNRYTPKIILIELDPSFVMGVRENEYDLFSVLLPYYHLYPELKPLIKKRSKWEEIKMLSKIYPYNSEITEIIRFNTNIDAQRNWIFNGYIPIKNKQMKMSSVNISQNELFESFADPEKIKALGSIIKMCENKNIELYFINSPIFYSEQKKTEDIAGSTRQVLEVLKVCNAKYNDYSLNPLFKGQLQLFADNLHLNESGATKFSQIIGKALKQRKFDTNN